MTLTLAWQIIIPILYLIFGYIAWESFTPSFFEEVLYPSQNKLLFNSLHILFTALWPLVLLLSIICFIILLFIDDGGV